MGGTEQGLVDARSQQEIEQPRFDPRGLDHARRVRGSQQSGQGLGAAVVELSLEAAVGPPCASGHHDQREHEDHETS